MTTTPTGIGEYPVPLYELSSLPSTPIEAEAVVYRVENDLLCKGSDIQDKNARGHYQRLVLREKDSLLARIKTMQATGMPVQAIKDEVDRAILQLETSARQFISNCERSQHANVTVADQFAAITARTNASSQLQFAGFTPPSRNPAADAVRTSIRETAKLGNKPKSEQVPKNAPESIEEKKTQLARCVMTIDPESPLGAMPCLAHHSKGLSEAEKKELSDFEPNAVMGKAINDVAVVPAVVSKAVNAAVGGAVKILTLSALSEACLTEDPANYDTRMKEATRALNGENPEFNKALKEATPAWMLTAGATLAHWDHQLDQLDKAAQEKYRTIPGIVKEGVTGGTELIIGAAVGPVIKESVRIVKATSQTVAKTSKNTIRFLKDELDAVKLPAGEKPPIISNNTIPQAASNPPILPFSEKKMKHGEVGGITYNLRRQQIALQENQKDVTLLEKLSKELPTVEIPNQFPQVRTQLMVNHKTQYIKGSNIEAFYYKPINDDVVLFMRSVNRSNAGKERLEQAVVTALDFAQEQKGRVFVTWDPLTHSIAKLIDEKSKNSIIGIGKLSNGPYAEPFHLIEIAKKPHNIVAPVKKSPITPLTIDESGGAFVPRKIDLSKADQPASFCFSFQKQVDSKSLHVFIKYLGITKPNGDFLEYIACSPKKIPSTTGLTHRAFQALKELAKELQVENVFIQWKPLNDRLLKVFYKNRNFQYIGHQKGFIVEESSKSYSVFKMTVSDVKPSLPGLLKEESSSALNSNKILQKIYGTMEGEEWMNLAIEKMDLQSLLPVFKQDSSERVWQLAVESSYPSFSKEVHIQYLKRHSSGLVAKMTQQGQSFIVKENLCEEYIIQELMGLDILNSLKLNHLNVPTPLAVGRYGEGRLDGAFIVKSYMPGDTLEEMMQKMGSSALGSQERQVLFSDLTQASYFTGKSLAEFQRKVLEKTKPNKIQKKDVDFFIDGLKSQIDSVETNLIGIKSIDFERHADKIESIIKDFAQDPGLPSYGFRDLCPAQLTWSSHHYPALGIVDTEAIPVSFKASRQPRAPIYQEYYGFFHSLSADGLSYGLSWEEVKNLQAAFHRGYMEEGVNTSMASNRFFDFEQSLWAIESIATSEPMNKEALLALIREFKRKYF